MVSTKSNIIWSKYQEDIFNNVANGVGNTAIIARAGSAKTTTLVESVRRVKKGNKILVVAFNKHIQSEIASKLPANVECMTLHSLGFRAVRMKFGSTLNEYKTHDIVKSILNKKDYDLTNELCRTVSFCKNTLSDTPEKIGDIIDQYNIETFTLSREEFIQHVSLILRKCKDKTDEIDYDDMIWFPFVFNLNPGKWDYVFIDEMQDLNLSQLVLALSTRKKNTRIFVALDDHQAIYGWRGADFETVNELVEKLEPVRLPLPICYRCPTGVVKLAQKFVPDIEPFDKNKAGNISYITDKDFLKQVKKGDVVLSRTNAALVKFCFKLLKQGVPANIQGRDIGGNLLSFLKKSKASTIKDLLSYISVYQKEETSRLRASGKRVDHVIDKCECLINLAEECSSIKELQQSIKDLFEDVKNNDLVLFSTIHSFKGKEANTVYLFAWTVNQSSTEEKNINYVGLTRTKSDLIFVSKEK